MAVAGVLLLTITGVAGFTYYPPSLFEMSVFYDTKVLRKQMNESEYVKLYVDNVEIITRDMFTELVRFHKSYSKYNPSYVKSPGLFGDNLEENESIIVPSGLYSNMTKLKIVTLTECNLLSLHEDVFSGSYNIRSLYLNRNYFKRFEEKTFFDLEELEVLDLSENNITHLPEKLFYNTERLKTLKMQYNLLDEIKERLFLHLSELEYLDLRFNRIKEIKGEQFFGLRSLMFLNISDNQLSSLAFTTQLSDSGNYSVLKNCYSLTDIQLANNSLTEVYVDWKMPLKMLDTVNLAFNKIQTVEVKLPYRVLYDQVYSRRIKFHNNPFVCDCRLLRFVEIVHKWWKLIDKNENLKCKEPKGLENQPLVILPLTSFTCGLVNNSEYNCPEHCTCKYRWRDNANIVNCTRAGLQQVPPFLPLHRIANHTELILDYNRLTSFSIPQNRGYEKVTHFYLSHNIIKSFNISGFSKKIKVLDVSHNYLPVLTPEVTLFLEHIPYLNRLLLNDNPWLCDCDTIPLFKLLRKKYLVVEYLRNITCPGNIPMAKFTVTELCPGIGNTLDFILIVLAILSFLILLLNALYYGCRNQRHICCFQINWKVLHWIVPHSDVHVDKKYDAFISYAKEDEPFIFEHIIPELEERGETKLKLCLHFRDWKGGDFIPSQILHSVQNSRKTIVVLSPSFLKSAWGIVEFRAAHSETLRTGTSKVIVILKEELDETTELEDELKAYLQTNTYIKWGSPWFWQQLKSALPHSPEDQDDNKCFFGCFPNVSKDTRSQILLQNVCLKSEEVTCVT